MLVKTKGHAKRAATRKKDAPGAHPSTNGRVSANGHEPAGREDKDLDTVYQSVTKGPETVHLEDWIGVPCPYCGEEFEVHVTSEQDGQTMYEDCEVCCRPVSLHIHVEEGELQVDGSRS